LNIDEEHPCAKCEANDKPRPMTGLFIVHFQSNSFLSSIIMVAGKVIYILFGLWKQRGSPIIGNKWSNGAFFHHADKNSWMHVARSSVPQLILPRDLCAFQRTHGAPKMASKVQHDMSTTNRISLMWSMFNDMSCTFEASLLHDDIEPGTRWPRVSVYFGCSNVTHENSSENLNSLPCAADIKKWRQHCHCH
jgi:hypothetical protein